MIVHTAIPSPRPAVQAEAVTARRLPLYLYGRNPTQVDLDGPALRVRRKDKADNRYPLARVSRILSGMAVEWHSRALKACLEAQIPIIFLDKTGEPQGHLQPALRKPSRLDTLLEELLDRPDGHAQYALWLRAERMRTLLVWHRTSIAQGREPDPQAYRELARRYVYQGEDPSLGLAGNHIYNSALYALALQHIHRAGTRAIHWGQDGVPLHLANDLSALLRLALALELQGLGQAAQVQDAALLTVLHAFGPTLNQRSQEILGRLVRRLTQLLEEWQ